MDGGLFGCRSIGATATASTPVPFLVVRDAHSQIRSLPETSVHSIFFKCVHFASAGDNGEILLMVGPLVEDDIVKE